MTMAEIMMKCEGGCGKTGDITILERLALVRDRARRIREIREEPEATGDRVAKKSGEHSGAVRQLRKPHCLLDAAPDRGG
jgi:hypothetical protein